MQLVSRWLHGSDPSPSSFLLSRWIFLRLLGVVFAVAFLSYHVQLDGLIGSHGLLPVAEYLKGAREQLGTGAYSTLPTICWLADSDTSLHLLAGAGSVLAFLLVCDLAPFLVLPGLWALYLSLVIAGQTFYSFQWDTLLLETALFAAFVAPVRLAPRLGSDGPPSRLGLWLLRWLLFKLMFLSGVTKLLSGDAAWWGLRALPVHYETQPLPTWIGWYAYHLPGWFHAASQLAMWVIEISVPILVFTPRRLRHLAALALIGLQVAIAATGNYTFFNLLTATLCVSLLDNRLLASLPLLGRLAPVPGQHSSTPQSFASGGDAPRPAPGGWRRAFRTWVVLPVACGLLGLSALVFFDEMVRTRAGARQGRPAPAASGGARRLGVQALDIALDRLDRSILTWARPVLSRARRILTVNGYGLFRVMTTERAEIILEGSNDGREWREYGFRWKPGALDRHPGFVAPYQPRLDWQMWFAALHPPRQAHWLRRLVDAVLEGRPAVLGLLGENPFPEKPPRFVRLLYYRYRFAELGGEAWWRRELRGVLAPPISRGPGSTGDAQRRERVEAASPRSRAR